MTFEIALVFSVLGVAFFLVYLSSQLNADDIWIQGLKTILILVSLIFIMLNAGMNINLLDAHNSTLDTPLSNNTYLHLEQNLSSNLWFIIWTFVFFMVLFILYFISRFLINKKNG